MVVGMELIDSATNNPHGSSIMALQTSKQMIER